MEFNNFSICIQITLYFIKTQKTLLDFSLSITNKYRQKVIIINNKYQQISRKYVGK